MNGNALLRETALQALVDERSLAVELDAVMRDGEFTHPAAQLASTIAAAGELSAALRELVVIGIDPLVPEVAACRPTAVRAAIDERRVSVSSAPASGMLIYLAVVFGLQATIASVIWTFVMPVMQRMSGAGAPWFMKLALVLAPLFAVVSLVLGVMLLVKGRRGTLARRLLPSLDGSRRAHAAFVLTQHGASAAEAAKAMSIGVLDDARTLEEQAMILETRAHREASRLRELVRLGGTLLALAIALSIALSVLGTWVFP